MLARGALVMDEVLELDLRRLRGADGGPLVARQHRILLEGSLPRSEAVSVRQGGRLAGYAYLWRLEHADWFVGGLAVDRREAAVVLALRTGFLDLLSELGVRRVHSHVLRANADSQRLHRKLGFAIAQEDERAVAFVAEAGMLRERLGG